MTAKLTQKEIKIANSHPLDCTCILCEKLKDETETEYFQTHQPFIF